MKNINFKIKRNYKKIELNESIKSIIHQENIEADEKTKLLSILFFDMSQEYSKKEQSLLQMLDQIEKNSKNYVESNLNKQVELMLPLNNSNSKPDYDIPLQDKQAFYKTFLDIVNKSDQMKKIDISSLIPYKKDQNIVINNNIGTFDLILLEGNDIEQLQSWGSQSSNDLSLFRDIYKDSVIDLNSNGNQSQLLQQISSSQEEAKKFKLIPSNLAEFLKKRNFISYMNANKDKEVDTNYQANNQNGGILLSSTHNLTSINKDVDSASEKLIVINNCSGHNPSVRLEALDNDKLKIINKESDNNSTNNVNNINTNLIESNSSNLDNQICKNNIIDKKREIGFSGNLFAEENNKNAQIKNLISNGAELIDANEEKLYNSRLSKESLEKNHNYSIELNEWINENYDSKMNYSILSNTENINNLINNSNKASNISITNNFENAKINNLIYNKQIFKGVTSAADDKNSFYKKPDFLGI